jgi:hypothetical protein
MIKFFYCITKKKNEAMKEIACNLAIFKSYLLELIIRKQLKIPKDNVKFLSKRSNRFARNH